MRVATTLALLLLFATPAAAIPRSGADTPSRLLFKQARLFKQANFQAMYATYTPNFRKRCPWRKFLRGQAQARQVLGVHFTLRGVRVRLATSRRALLAYRFVTERGQISITGDLYVKMGNAWYDEYDRVTSC
jgi:hypothetical protein